jgi:hypothetical protein
VWALIDLVRRPADQVKSSKWLWAAIIILLSNLALGAILYFLIGREVAPVDDSVGRPEADPDRARRAVDTLYGDGDES